MCKLNQVEFWCELLSLQDTFWNVGVDINPEMLDHARGQPKGKHQEDGCKWWRSRRCRRYRKWHTIRRNGDRQWIGDNCDFIASCNEIKQNQQSEAWQVIVPYRYYMVLIMWTLPHSLLIHAYRQSLDQGSATPSMCAKCGIRWVSNPFLLLDCLWKHKNTTNFERKIWYR